MDYRLKTSSVLLPVLGLMALTNNDWHGYAGLSSAKGRILALPLLANRCKRDQAFTQKNLVLIGSNLLEGLKVK